MSPQQDMIYEEIERIVDRGENACNPDENTEIKVKLKEKDITNNVIEWLKTHRARNIESIYEFIDFLEQFLTKKKKPVKKDEEIKKIVSSSHKDYRNYIKDKQKFINTLVKDEENRLKEEWLPPELDTILLSELIYARKIVLKRATTVQRALNDIIINQRRVDRKTKEKIYELVKQVVFAILLVDLRIVEILLFLKKQNEVSLSLELLEWDLDTLELVTYRLTQYTHSLFKKLTEKQWDEEYHKETAELMMLFQGGTNI